MSNNMFDILIEIRKVDKQISEQKFKVQKSLQELLVLENNMSYIKELQLKALLILKDTEKKLENTDANLNNVHENYHTLIEYLHAQIESVSDDEHENVTSYIDKVKKHRDDLKNKIIISRTEKEKVAMEVNEVDLQISIQKKKNAAMLLRLQKTLQECLQEERDLTDKLKLNSIIQS